jgi:steroid 5-alpha reductase family enzyme
MTAQILALLAITFAVTIGSMVALWTLYLRNGDPSFIDVWWPLGFLVVACLSFVITDGDPTRRALLVGITAVWSVRLSTYLFARWRRNGPDKRYMNLIRHADGNPRLFVLKSIFLSQGLLMWLVSLPLVLGQVYRSPEGVQAAGYAGLVLCVIGIGFESIGDSQLRRFKADPANTGRVMDKGLWRYTRHPNYFGDAVNWFGLALVAIVNPVTAMVLLSPCLMTFLLIRWSGVAPLERRLGRHKPGYADYVARTSGFFPRPPRPATVASAATLEGGTS